jgi:hypothetical protein
MDPLLEPARLPRIADGNPLWGALMQLAFPGINSRVPVEDSDRVSVQRQLTMATVTGCTPPIANHHGGASPCCEAMVAVGPSPALSNTMGHERPGNHLETDSGASEAKT